MSFSAVSAYLCVLCGNDHFNAEDAEVRRGPQRRRICSSLFHLPPNVWGGIIYVCEAVHSGQFT